MKKILRLFAIGLFAAMMVSASFITSEAMNSQLEYTKRNDSVRKSNRNYSNACELLSKKRMTKAKPHRSKRKMSKWR